MHRGRILLAVGALATLVSAARMWTGAGTALDVALQAQASAPAVAPGDWPSYNRDLAGTRYSPLKEVTAANVSRLAPAWS